VGAFQGLREGGTAGITNALSAVGTAIGGKAGEALTKVQGLVGAFQDFKAGGGITNAIGAVGAAIGGKAGETIAKGNTHRCLFTVG
jgi:hypothetical protein